MSELLGNELFVLKAPTGITDQTGNGYDGIYNGGMGTIADSGEGGVSAYLFTDTLHSISMGDILSAPAGLSAACWFKSTANNITQVFLSQYGLAGARSWYFGFISTGKLRVLLSSGGTNFISVNTDDNVTVKDVWVHCGFTWDGTTVIIYVNGVAVASTPTGAIPATIFNSTADIKCGAVDVVGQELQIRGRADDFRIWTSVLSPEDMALVAEDRSTYEPEVISIVSAVPGYRKIDLTGTFSGVETISRIRAKVYHAGTPLVPTDVQSVAASSSFEVPGGFTNTGLATDGTNFWYADWTNGDLVKMTPSGTLLGTLNVATASEHIQGVVYDPRGSGSLWYCRYQDNQIRHVDLTGTEIGADTISVVNPNGVGIHLTTYDLYVLRNTLDSNVYRYVGGVLTQTIALSSIPASHSIDHVWIDSTRDHMWVSFSNSDTSLTDKIYIYRLDGILIAIIDNLKINIEGIVVDSIGRLWSCHDAKYHSSVPNGNRVFITDVASLIERFKVDTLAANEVTVDFAPNNGTWNGSIDTPVGGPYYVVATSLDLDNITVATSAHSSNSSVSADTPDPMVKEALEHGIYMGSRGVV